MLQNYGAMLGKFHKSLLFIELLVAVLSLDIEIQRVEAQERHAKVRISNAGLTITALPLLAARDWGTFKANGLDVEIIVMSPPLGAAAMAQGDIDYVAGVGPASVAATLTGLPSRAIWFSSDRISYWVQAAPQFKTLQDLKGKKIALSGGVGGTNHVALSIALEKSGFNPKDYTMVAIPGQQIQILYSLESGFVDAALMSPPHIFAAAKKGFTKLMDVGAMVEMPGGGLTAMVRTIQERPAETKRTIRALQVAKDEVRKSKPKTVELIMRLLKMDKEGAGDTYDAFQTTLNPTGIPNRPGIDNLVRSLQAQGRFTDRKVIFNEVADDRLATEVARSWATRFRSFRRRRPFKQFKSFKTFKPTDGKVMNDISCDVLVVGAGLAGFTAAVRAAERGAKVLLIDKSHGELGDGNVLMASGSLRAGGKSPKTAAAELYDFVMSEGVGYPDLVKAWSETCGRAIGWLETVGVEIEETAPGRIWLNQESEISYGPVYKKDVGGRALTSLKKQFLNLGGNYLNGSEGVRLIVEDGRVTGLIAKQTGAEIELRAGATILATGGFSANPELVKKYIGAHADRCKLRGSKQDTGDGLRMALAVSAKAVNLQYFYGHLISRKALIDDRFWPYPRLDSFVDEGILIDHGGNRFVDEGRGDVAVANELARSDDPTGAALIFDYASWDAAKDDPFSKSVKTPAPNPWLLDNDGDIFHDETIEGLARKIGVDGASLAKTVEEYNRSVQSGNPSSLGVARTGKPKPLQPSYYGLKVVPGITFTMGGVLVNGRCEALNSNEKSIAGLYAAGDTIGGLMGGYRGGYTGGLMQAIVTGILAGENAARYIKPA